MSCFSVLRIEHVGYYGNRIIVFGQREKRKLPNATSKFVRKTKTYRIEGMFAVQIEKYFKGKSYAKEKLVKFLCAVSINKLNMFMTIMGY